MEHLIKIELQKMGEETMPTVDARELWEKLEVKTLFASWIERRIKEAQLIEQQDFRVISKIGNNPLGGRPFQEYLLSVDAAKHIAMLERTEIGRKIRQHFIDFEKKGRAALSMLSEVFSALHPASPPAQEESILDREARRLGRERLDLLNLALANAQQMAKNAGLEGNQALLAAAKAVQKLYAQDPLLLLEVELTSSVQSKYLTVSDLGKSLGLSAHAMNERLQARGYQRSFRDVKGRLQWELTEEGKTYAVYLDTGKKHANGTPIQQIKWAREVVSLLADREAEALRK